MANNTGEKFGGRKKGTPNKTTEQVKQAFRLLVEENLEQLRDDIAGLEPKDRIKCVVDIAKFILPTLKNTEYKDADNKISKIVREIVYPN
ncbi:hypothetical protein [Bizionia paragorgiae]|uniref:hypothetical protein n=1 Tax=Bizionia paragorgiae TaxID=283786 RepID=UPI003A9099CF